MVFAAERFNTPAAGFGCIETSKAALSLTPAVAAALYIYILSV